MPLPLQCLGTHQDLPHMNCLNSLLPFDDGPKTKHSQGCLSTLPSAGGAAGGSCGTSGPGVQLAGAGHCALELQSGSASAPKPYCLICQVSTSRSQALVATTEPQQQASLSAG